MEQKLSLTFKRAAYHPKSFFFKMMILSLQEK